ncbi:MAG: hypothetical protein E6230_19010, partial [Paenibacillus dendritiformis]|nr:hypothetical protein [Paenibacillus dendritiformis]
KIDLKHSKSQSLDEENGPSPPLHKKQGFSNSLKSATFPADFCFLSLVLAAIDAFLQECL